MLEGVAGDAVASGIDVIDVFERAREHLQDRTKIAAFTLDVPPTYPSEMFARGFSRARMWAMYAQHSGACLIFDRERLDGAMRRGLDGREFVRSGDVHYSDFGPFPPMLDVQLVEKEGLDAALEIYINDNWRTLLLRKNTDWAGEAEHRWIVREPATGPIFVPYGDALVGVVGGQDMSDQNAALLVGLAHAHSDDVAVARMWWRNGYPTVVPVPTDDE